MGPDLLLLDDQEDMLSNNELPKHYSPLQWQEYRRTAHLLKDSQGSKAWFLRCYALYLAGEKRKEEERVELSGPLGRAETVNKVE